MKKVIVFFCMVFLAINFVLAYNNFNSSNNVLYECGNINQAGVYTLNQSFTANCSGAPIGQNNNQGCFTILENNVSIEGNNFEIINGTCDAGIIQDRDMIGYSTSKDDNTTVENIILTNFTMPVKYYMLSSLGHTFENMTINGIKNLKSFWLYSLGSSSLRNSKFYASSEMSSYEYFLYLRYFRNSVIENNYFYDFDAVALYSADSTKNAIIRNNYFINPLNSAIFLKTNSYEDSNYSVEYNNSYGRIGLYGFNNTHYTNLSVVEESDINISKGFLYMNPDIVYNQTPLGRGEFYSNYQINESIGILKDGVECSSCVQLPSNPGIVKFNFSEWGNFSVIYTSELDDYYKLFECKTSEWVENATYKLMNNITTNSTCFGIDANNITLDGNGYWIKGNGSENSYGTYTRYKNNSNFVNLKISNFSKGIYVRDTENTSLENCLLVNSETGFEVSESPNITLKDNNLSGNNINFDFRGDVINDFSWDIDNSNILDYDKILYYNFSVENHAFDSANLPNAGMFMCINCSNINVSELNLSSHSLCGIYFMNVTDGIIKDNLIYNNSWGIYLQQATNNLIQNNFLVNLTGGIYSSDSSQGNNYTQNNISESDYNFLIQSGERLYNNLFNSSQNFIQGNNSFNNSIGGNYWAYPNGTGFSETCTDSDSNGICDNNYTLSVNNIDYLPLSSWPSSIFGSSSSSEEAEEDTTSTTSSTPTVQIGEVNSTEFSGELRYGYRGDFKVNGERHRIYLRGVNRENKTAKFDIYSSKKSVEVKVGEIKKVDLDNDGVEDIELLVNSIDDNRVAVNLDLKVVGGEVEEVEVIEDAKEENKTEKAEEIIEEVKTNYFWKVFFIVLIVVLGIVYWKRNFILEKMKKY